MAIQRAVLLIADIGGYTRFMREHRFALAHAQESVATLLEAVIDASKPLKVAKLEGDAAFLYAPVDELKDVSKIGETIANIRHGFLAKQRDMTTNRFCSCKGCTEVEVLKLKFVGHVGDVAFQKVKRYTELAGVDVILVHRMLKNDVPVPEYALVSDALVGDLDPQIRKWAKELEHDFEGLGRTRTHYIDFAELSEDVLVQPKRRPGWRLFLERVSLVWRSLPYWLGFKKACATFHNVEGEIVEKVPELASGAEDGRQRAA